MKVALYARTSTSDGRQDLGLQVDELRAEATRRGWTIVQEHTDQASGEKDDRPGLVAALEQAARHEIDVLLVWKLDRLAGSLRVLLERIEEIERAKVGVVSLRESWVDTTTATGRFLIHIVSIVRELERSLEAGE